MARGTSGVKVTTVVATAEPAAAVIAATPAVSPEVRVAVATLLTVVLVTASLPSSPRLVVKVTTVPSATLLLN